MKKFFLTFLAIATLLFSGIKLSAQIQSVEVASDYLKAQRFDLGKNGVVFMANSNSLTNNNSLIQLVRLDTTGKLVWNKEIEYEEKTAQHYCVASANGEDIYILNFINFAEDGDIVLTHVNAQSGEYTNKKYAGQPFGIILTMYANKDYLFVLANLDGKTFYNDGKTSQMMLFRFKKSTLEMERLEKHQMLIGTKENNIFWQPIRVTDDFVEAYVVNEIGDKKISLMLAHFDNEGQIISTSKGEINLVEDFIRSSSSGIPMGPGISRGVILSNQGTVEGNVGTISPMAFCYLLYDPFSGHYFAYGVSGPKHKQKAGMTEYSGFYIAEFDKDFKALAMKENIDQALLYNNPEFKTNGGSIDAYITTKGKLMVHLCSYEDHYFYSVSTDNLTCDAGYKKQIKAKIMYGISMQLEVFSGNYIASKEELLVNDKTLEKADNPYYIGTSRCQYVAYFKKDKMIIYSKKMK